MQTTILLNVAGEVTRYAASFPPEPGPTLLLLRKIDHCFASLLCGSDVETREPLPGFENGPRAGMTTTDMVRCKSLAYTTRLYITDLLSKPFEPQESAKSKDDISPDYCGGSDDGSDGDDDNDDDDDDDEDLHMDVSRIYQRTLVHLGERLGEDLTPVPPPTPCSP